MPQFDPPQSSPEIEPPRESDAFADNLDISRALQTAGVRTADDEELVRSIDMIFQLQQRSEEIRAHLEKIDHALLSSRTVAGLTRSVVALLERDLDLVAARILFQEDHPLASLLLWDPPEGAGIVPADFLESEGLCGGDPFILDDLSGELSSMLFGDRSGLVASAALAVLSADNVEVGVLCLGSDDPCRYRGGMNTEIIASLADKIALGIANAWDHEKRFEDALTGATEGIAAEAFFREALQWEFHRACRYRGPFALMGLSWLIDGQEVVTRDRITRLVRRNVRSSDLVGEGEGVGLWVLLPESGVAGARQAAERLTEVFRTTFGGRAALYVGLTEYSTKAAVASVLLQEARLAVEEACVHDTHAIVVRYIATPGELSENASAAPLVPWP